MKQNRITKRIIPWIMTLALMAGELQLPLPASVARAEEPEPAAEKTITGLGTGAITNPVVPYSAGNYWSGSNVYYGKYDGTPTKYRVLDKASGDFGVNGGSLLLDCDSILYEAVFDQRGSESSEPIEWAKSKVRTGLNGDSFLDFAGNFTDAEKKAIAESSKVTAVDGDGNGGTSLTPQADDYAEFDFIRISQEKIFLLDQKEVTRPSYGYSNTPFRANNRLKTGRDGEKKAWWLRNHNNSDSSHSKAGVVNRDVGQIESRSAITIFDVGVSPAFNVSLNSVLFSTLVSGTAGQPGAEYKLTLKDENMGIAVAEGESVVQSDTTVTIPYTITNDTDSGITADQVSVLITDKAYTESDASVLQYTALTVEEGTVGSSGTGTFMLDTSKVTGTWGTDYHVYLLAEEVNLGDDIKLTDYASSPTELTDVSSLVVSQDSVSTYGQFENLSVIKEGESTGDEIRVGDRVKYSFDYQPPEGGVVSSYTVFYNKGDMKSTMVKEYGFNETVIIDGNLLFTPFDANYYGDWKVWSIVVNFAQSPESIGEGNSITFYDKAYLNGSKRYMNPGADYCVADLSELSFTVEKTEQAEADHQGPDIGTGGISIDKSAVDIADDAVVNISVPITDDSGIAEWHIAVTDGKHIRIRHEFPDTYDPFSEAYDEGSHTGITRAYSKSLGDYQILYILAYDRAGNETAVYNSAFSASENFVYSDYSQQQIVESYLENRTKGTTVDLSTKAYSVVDGRDTGVAPVFRLDDFSNNGERFAFGEDVILRTPIEGSLSKFVIGFGIERQEGGTYVLEHNGQYEPMLFQATRFGSCFIKYISATDTAGRKSALYNSAECDNAAAAGIDESKYDSVSDADLSSMNWVVGLKDEATGILASNEEFEAGSTSMNVAEQEMSSSSESYRNITDTSVHGYDESFGTDYTDRFFWNIELENFDHQNNNKIKVWVPVPGMKNGSRVLIRHLKHKENANDANDVEFFNPVVEDGLAYFEVDGFSPILVSYNDEG
ncbi:MAG: DUF6273 domain-containing protein, partial [Lachnospiraceae bacterium]|nr:DUF6273 domain-containing protein [Lachnospiraceae bacterium]